MMIELQTIKGVIDKVFYSMPHPTKLMERYEEAWTSFCPKCNGILQRISERSFKCLSCEDQISQDAITRA